MKVGDKVVCINDDFSMHPNISKIYKSLPRKNVTYTVRSINIREKRILLEEIKNEITKIRGILLEPGFNLNRFAQETQLVSVEQEELEMS